MLSRSKNKWPVLLALVLALIAGAYIACISWKGYGANFSRMIALQIIVANLAILIHFLQIKKKHWISSGILLLSIPCLWGIISSQWLHLYMIFDSSLLDQRLTILVGELTFLLLVYLGWIPVVRSKNSSVSNLVGEQ